MNRRVNAGRMGALVILALAVGTGCDSPSGGGAESASETPPVELSPLERLEAAVVASPDDASVWGELARERLAAEDADGAAEAAVRAIEVSDSPAPEDAETLARAHIAAERWQEAQSALTQLIELEPDRPGAHIELARVEEHLGHPEAAETAYRAAVATDDDDVEARLHLASLLIARCRTPETDGEDTQAPFRTEASALLAAARTHLDADDSREGAIAAYEEELAELETAAEARRSEPDEGALALIRANDQVEALLRGALSESAFNARIGSLEGPPSEGLLEERRQLSRRGGGLVGTGGGGRVGGLGGLVGTPAAPAPAGPTVRLRVSAAASGGLTTAVVNRIAGTHADAFRRCHTGAARHDPSLAGVIAVQLTITEAGVPLAVNAPGSNRTEALRACVRQVVWGMMFPTSEGRSQATITATFQ